MLLHWLALIVSADLSIKMFEPLFFCFVLFFFSVIQHVSILVSQCHYGICIQSSDQTDRESQDMQWHIFLWYINQTPKANPILRFL